jgi:hypothetical protein
LSTLKTPVALVTNEVRMLFALAGVQAPPGTASETSEAVVASRRAPRLEIMNWTVRP